MLGRSSAFRQILMVENSDRFFLRPRYLLSAKKIDFSDAINLVVYAKLPLVTALRGRDLIAGYLSRDESGAVHQSMHIHGKHDLSAKYATHVDRLSYPVDPSQYELLLDSMCRANELTLPFFFHEHHLIVHRRRRAAMFARLYKELQSHVAKGNVTLQKTDSEKALLLLAGAWMTNKTLQSYLDLNGVLPWFESDRNIESHAQVERVMLSDWLSPQTPVIDSGARHQTVLSEPAHYLNAIFQPQGTNIDGGQPATPRSRLGFSSTYPPVGYVANAPQSVVEADIASKASGSLYADAVEVEQDHLEGDIHTAELKPTYSEPAWISKPNHLANPREVTVNVVSPVLPEQEIYDERQLPSFLLAEKLLKHAHFTRGAWEAEPTPFEFQKAVIPPMVVGQSHLDSGLRTVPSTESSEVEADPDEELRYRFKVKRFKPSEIDRPEDTRAPALAAECDDSGNESSEGPQKELLDEPMMTKVEVAAFFNVSKGAIDIWRKEPDFPEGITLGSGSLRWERAEIRAYKDRRKSK